MVDCLPTQGDKSDVLLFVSLWLFPRIQLHVLFFNDVSVFGDDKFCKICTIAVRFVSVAAKLAQS